MSRERKFCVFFEIYGLWRCSIQREGIIFCVIEGKKGVCVCYESNLRWLGRFLASLVGVKRTRKGCSIRHVLLG